MGWKVEKLWQEEIPAFVPRLRRLCRAIRHDWSDITHAYVDVFVEGHRDFAYTLGHVWAILVPAGILYALI